MPQAVTEAGFKLESAIEEHALLIKVKINWVPRSCLVSIDFHT
jgi:hypothetical protein